MDCLLSFFPKEPLWYILFVNILVPYFAYLFAHKNNMRLMKEKWLASFREEVSFLISCVEEQSELSLKVYKEKDHINPDLEEARVKLKNKMSAAKIKIELLYQQENTSDLNDFIYEIGELFEAANVSLNDDNEVLYVHAHYPMAQRKFMLFINGLAKKYSGQIKK